MTGDLKFYWGASGSSRQRKALMRLEEPNIMLTYGSQATDPWPEIDNLFIDCGGYSSIITNEDYQTPVDDYLDYVVQSRADYWVLRDYPCEPDLLEAKDATVGEHQQATLENHIKCWNRADDRNIDIPRISVIQGWEPADYLESIDMLRDHGVLSDYTGIGSVCRRNGDAQIRKVVNAVRDALPRRYKIHAFGVKQHALQYPDVRKALESADSQAYEYRARFDAFDRDVPHTFQGTAFQYLKRKRQIQELVNTPAPPTLQESYMAADGSGFTEVAEGRDST